MRHVRTRLMVVACLAGSALLALLAVGGSSAATGKSSASGFPVTFTRADKTVTFTSPPKVLVKDSEAAGLVAAAGGNLSHHLVAIANDNQQPLGPGAATLKSVPFISRNKDLSKEEILAQNPGLVIAHGYDEAPQDQLSALGVKSMVVNVCYDDYAKEHGGTIGYDAIYQDVTLMGRLLGTSAYAAKSVAHMKSTIASVRKQAPSLRKHLSKPTAAFTVLFQGAFFTYGGPSIANTQIKTLGLKNAFGNLTKRGTSLNAEQFIKQDPGVVVIGYEVGPEGPAATGAKIKRQLMAIPGIKQMTAVKRNRVIIVPDAYLLALSVEGTKLFADRIAAFK